MPFYFGIDFLCQPVNGVAWPVGVLEAVVAVPIAADAVLLFAPVGRVFGQKGGQDGAVVAEKGAHLLLNGQNVFAEQLGGKGGNKGGLVGGKQGEDAARGVRRGVVLRGGLFVPLAGNSEVLPVAFAACVHLPKAVLGGGVACFGARLPVVHRGEGGGGAVGKGGLRQQRQGVCRFVSGGEVFGGKPRAGAAGLAAARASARAAMRRGMAFPYGGTGGDSVAIPGKRRRGGRIIRASFLREFRYVRHCGHCGQILCKPGAV